MVKKRKKASADGVREIEVYTRGGNNDDEERCGMKYSYIDYKKGV